MNDERLPLPPATELRAKRVKRLPLVWLAPALCLLFLLACALATGALSPAPSAPATVAQPSAEMWQLAPEGRGAPVAVTVRSATESYELRRDADGFALAGEDSPLNDSAAKALIGCGASVLARRRVEGDRAQYGLGEDALSATFTYEDGSEWTLTLGDAVATGAGCYAAVESDEGVYVVNTALRATLAAGKNALYALPDLDERFTAQTLLKARVLASGKQAVCVARVVEDNPFNTVAELTEPIQYPANAERAAELYLALDALEPSGVAAASGADADWGLAQPLATLELSTQKGALRLRVGQAGDALTMRVDDEPTVYRLPDGALDFLANATVPYLLEQLPGLVALPKVQSVAVVAGTERYWLAVDRREGAESYTVNGAPVERERFISLYQELIGLLIERYQPDAKPTGTARVTFEYTLTDGSAWQLQFLPYDGQYDIVKRGDCTSLLISRAKVDAVVEHIKQCGGIQP